jgi:hypothetical protein
MSTCLTEEPEVINGSNDLVKINFTYFKSTGKYYTCGSLEIDKELISDCIYPRDIGRKLNRLKMLPGLSSGTWGSFFVCDPVNLYPELVNGFN